MTDLEWELGEVYDKITYGLSKEELEDYMIFVDEIDKTSSIRSIRLKDGRYPKYYIAYQNGKGEYPFDCSRVKILMWNQWGSYTIGKDEVISVRGKRLPDAEKVRCFVLPSSPGFDDRIRVICRSGAVLTCGAYEWSSSYDGLMPDEKQMWECFAYFKELSEVAGPDSQSDNVLSRQYGKLYGIDEESVLFIYLRSLGSPQERGLPECIIYPFGLNPSQKKAVEQAFSSQVSIIQGPPGTGKTQTILNIIANVVYQGKTVAVVSNNNSAVQNVEEKLGKAGLNFLTAFLGNQESKKQFLENQSGNYPDELGSYHSHINPAYVNHMAEKVDQLLTMRNQSMQLKQELLELQTEYQYFKKYYVDCRSEKGVVFGGPLKLPASISSQEMLAMGALCESADFQTVPEMRELLYNAVEGLFNSDAAQVLTEHPDFAPMFFQGCFYEIKCRELSARADELEKKLSEASLSGKASDLTAKSLELLWDTLSNRYDTYEARKVFDRKALYSSPDEFTAEYPVILSTTYMILNALGADYMYDYLIIDEASQVNLVTGALAFACAKNVVIVGDLQQLPSVCSNPKAAEEVWKRHSIPARYRYTTESLLSSALWQWPNDPMTLLQEHYRCDPRIIGFCNREFYHGELIAMTQDKAGPDALSLYYTAPGKSAKGHVNWAQLDIIKDKILPELKSKGYASEDIGIIAPYREQVAALRKQVGSAYEISTVHQFQGREKDAIILTSVDNVIGPFVDDPNMLNVAVSRAVKSLSVIMSRDPGNDKTNYGRLARYIRYQRGECAAGKLYPVFENLYQTRMQLVRDNAAQTDTIVREWIAFFFSLLDFIKGKLESTGFPKLGCVWGVTMEQLIRDSGPLSGSEREFVKGLPIDFLFFHPVDKTPVGAIIFDTQGWDDSEHAEWESMAEGIFKKYGLPLLFVDFRGAAGLDRMESIMDFFQETASEAVLEFLRTL